MSRALARGGGEDDASDVGSQLERAHAGRPEDAGDVRTQLERAHAGRSEDAADLRSQLERAQARRAAAAARYAEALADDGFVARAADTCHALDVDAESLGAALGALERARQEELAVDADLEEAQLARPARRGALRLALLTAPVGLALLAPFFEALTASPALRWFAAGLATVEVFCWVLRRRAGARGQSPRRALGDPYGLGPGRCS